MDMAKELHDIVASVEERCLFRFGLEETQMILNHTRRKCLLNGKGDEYIPVLFENELCDYVMRSKINKIGEMMLCVKSAGHPLV